MIDTQIFDELIEDPDTLDSLLKLINNQKVELMDDYASLLLLKASMLLNNSGCAICNIVVH